MEITRKDLSIVFGISDFDIEVNEPDIVSVIEKNDSFLKFIRSFGPNQKIYSLKKITNSNYIYSMMLIDILGLIDIRDKIYINLLTNNHFLKDLLDLDKNNSNLELEELILKTVDILTSSSPPYVKSPERLEHQNHLLKYEIKGDSLISLLVRMMEPSSKGFLPYKVTNFKLTIDYYKGLLGSHRRKIGIDEFEKIHGKIENINGFLSGSRKSIYEIKMSNFLHKQLLQDEQNWNSHLTDIFLSSM